MMRQSSAITGEAIFASYDGMRAEGTGTLAFLSHDAKPLEMRKQRILDALPPISRGDFSLFVQRVQIDDELYRIIGLVQKIRDFNKRDGIMGACVSVRDGEPDLRDVVTRIETHLFPIIENAVLVNWQGKPGPDDWNLLVNSRSLVPDTRWSQLPETVILHYVPEAGVDMQRLMQTCFEMFDLSGSIGRAIILGQPAGNSKPADAAFLADIETRVKAERQRIDLARSPDQPSTRISTEETVKSLVQQEKRINRAAKEARVAFEPLPARRPNSIDDVVGRQLVIEKRLLRIERKLKLATPGSFDGASPFDAAAKRKQPKQQVLVNSVVLAGGAALATILVVSIVLWFFFRGDQQEVTPLPVEPTIEAPVADEAATVPSLGTTGSQQSATTYPSECESLPTLAEQEACNDEER